MFRGRGFSSQVAGERPKNVIRNIGCMAHIDAGKTTTVERMLYYAGVTKSIGDVDKGTTVTDYLEMERERGITIVSAAVTFEWRNHRVNLVDTPGHVDFTIEVERSVRVLDGAVAIFDAVAGVQAQTETVWRQADRYGVPRIAFVNKYDREGASLERTMQMMKERLRAKPIALQLPIGEGVGFRGVLDLVRMEAIEWMDSTGEQMRVRPLSDAEKSLASVGREKMVEALCDADEAFLEQYLNDSAKCYDVNFVNLALRRATCSLKAVPVMIGAAFRNKGVQPLMDGVLMYLPSPVDRTYGAFARGGGGGKQKESNKDEEARVTIKADDKSEMVSLAWKVVHDRRMGLITYFRVISGALQSGKTLQITNKPELPKERANKVVVLMAQDMIQVPQVTAGNIGAIVGLKNVATGDTLMHGECKSPLVLQGIPIPPPVFFRAIEPNSLADQESLEESLKLLHKEDPSFQTHVHPDTGQTLIGGMGELHLEYILDRLQKHYKVQASVGEIMIAYRCAPKTESSQVVSTEHSYESSGKLIRGFLKARVYSGELSAASLHARVEDGRNVEWDAEGQEAEDDERKKVLACVAEGLGAACNRGNLRGYPLVNVGLSVLEWGLEGDTSSGPDWGLALKICAEKAVRSVWSPENDNALQVLEPAMRVEIRTEGDAFGAVTSDIASARRGVISDVRVEGREKVAIARVPLAKMMGYAKIFRSKTAGVGSYTMEFQEYVPSRD